MLWYVSYTSIFFNERKRIRKGRKDECQVAREEQMHTHTHTNDVTVSRSEQTPRKSDKKGSQKLMRPREKA